MRGDKLNTAIEFLITHVTSNGILSRDIYSLSKKSGISMRTLERAKSVTGVESKRGVGNKRLWVLADDVRANLLASMNRSKSLPVVYIETEKYEEPIVTELYTTDLSNAKPLDLSELKRIFLVCETTVFQGRYDYFAGHVPHILEEDIMIGCAFVFCSRSKSQISILQWQGDGYALFFKRSEYGRFPWPINTGVQAIEITLEDLKMLMEYPRLMLRLSGRPTPSAII